MRISGFDGKLMRKSSYICASCLNIYRPSPEIFLVTKTQKRRITQGFLRLKAEAQEQWRDFATEIKAGTRESYLKVLEQRGWVDKIAGDRKKLERLMINKRLGVYVGIDPTAPSLHMGHMVPLMALFWLHVNGFHTVSLLGGATCGIGDPTGRTTSRPLQQSSVRKANIVSMHYQLKSVWQGMLRYAAKYDYQREKCWHREVINNNLWLNKLPVTEFLKVAGSGMRIGTMLGKDTARNMMEGGGGMSFAEFSYPVLQAWDWWHLYETKGVQMQIGGSDQFGNITAGVDAIKFMKKNHPHPDVRMEEEDPEMAPVGFTTPLLTTASGEKFGKSAGNAVWLDREMTSCFELYQYFLRCADADVGRYLKMFTFIPLPHIEEIMTQHVQEPSKRVAQHKLAREVLEIVHGPLLANEAESQHRQIFNQTLISANPKAKASADPYISASLNPHAPQTNFNNAPPINCTLPESLVRGQPIARVLYAAGMVSSRSEGHRLASKRGAYIGSRPGQVGGMGDEIKFTPILNWHPQETEKYIIDGDLLILRVGKWKVKIVKIISDADFEERGLSAPGWKENLDPAEEDIHKPKTGNHNPGPAQTDK